MNLTQSRAVRTGLISWLMVAGLAGQPAQSNVSARHQFLRSLVAAAVERTHHQVTYDPGYVAISYPGGDVPANSGVCSDEIIRIYRAVAIDLQKEVHEDLTKNPAAYPLSRWHQKRPDSNIDHRRVPNLMAFFSRKGAELPVTSRAEDYQPGDLVTWDLGNGAIHIGMVVDQRALLTRRFIIVHNIGAGPEMEDVLFDWKIIGHYRYFGPEEQSALSIHHSAFNRRAFLLVPESIPGEKRMARPRRCSMKRTLSREGVGG